MSQPLDDDFTDAAAAIEVYCRTRDVVLRDRIVVHYRWLAVRCARRFVERGEPLDDLVQIAMIGLVNALDRFDPAMGVPFGGFAMPTMTGELRRYFRDSTWAVHVPRRLRELSAGLALANERLQTKLGREPSVDELAADLGVGADDVLDALEAGGAHRARSMSGTADDPSAGFDLGDEDPDLDRAEARLTVERLLETLPEREKLILRLRFLEDRSQTEIAAVVGTSQAHVSRLIRAALAQLRPHLEADNSGHDGQPYRSDGRENVTHDDRGERA